MAELCECGRESKYTACAHAAGGETKEIHVQANRVTCKECIKLIADNTFVGICPRCLDKLQGPDDPEKELAEIQAQEEEVAGILDELKPKLEAIAARKRELQRHLVTDKLEELFSGLQELLAFIEPGGALYKHHQQLRALVDKIKEGDPGFPNSLSTDIYNSVINRANPLMASLIDLVRNGGLEPDISLPRLLARICKNPDTYFSKAENS